VGPAGVRLFGTWALAFTLGLGLPGVWMATNLDWGVRTLWLVLAFRHGRWKQIEV
jgi:Na+-driven multidrug efflux pump